jgi:hypothetical protein
LSSFFVIVMLSFSVFFLPDLVSDLYAQNTTGSQPPLTVQPTASPTTLGVKITTPASNQQVPFQNNNNRSLQITGTSTDTIDTDCQVSVIANDIRPYQNTTATGPGGEIDYSTWIYSLAPPLIKEDPNKVTARISCIDSTVLGANDTNMVKHSSVFFTIQSTPTTSASMVNESSSSTTDSSNATQAATTATTTSTSTRTKAVPYFVSNPNCQVELVSHDLSCTIKLAGIENIAKVQPFLHADLTASCINPAGNIPPDNVRIIPLIGDSKTIRAVLDVNCPPSMTPSFTYKNVQIQVGDVLLSIPGIFSSR